MTNAPIANFAAAVESFTTMEQMKAAQAIFNARWRAIQGAAATAAIVEKNILPGSQVTFTGRYGMKLQGVVRKVNAKSIHVFVAATNVTWRVSPSLVTVVA